MIRMIQLLAIDTSGTGGEPEALKKLRTYFNLHVFYRHNKMMLYDKEISWMEVKYGTKWQMHCKPLFMILQNGTILNKRGKKLSKITTAELKTEQDLENALSKLFKYKFNSEISKWKTKIKKGQDVLQAPMFVLEKLNIKLHRMKDVGLLDD